MNVSFVLVRGGHLSPPAHSECFSSALGWAGSSPACFSSGLAPPSPLGLFALLCSALLKALAFLWLLVSFTLVLLSPSWLCLFPGLQIIFVPMAPTFISQDEVLIFILSFCLECVNKCSTHNSYSHYEEH